MIPKELEEWWQSENYEKKNSQSVFVKISKAPEIRSEYPIFDTGYKKKWKELLNSFKQHSKNDQ